MRRGVLLGLIAVAWWSLAIGRAVAGDGGILSDGKVPGQPFQYLQQQIDELKAKVDAIQPTAGTIKVYDASNQFLGLFLGFDFFMNPSARIFVPALNHSLLIQIYGGTKRGYLGGGIISLEYETVDCTGPTAYLQYSERLDIFPVATTDMHYRYYRPAGTGLTKEIKPLSSWGPDGCAPISFPQESSGFYEVIEISEQDIPFNLPVALPLRYEFKGQ